MECFSGNSIKLRTLFLDNGNWWKRFLKYHHPVRISIIVHVLKLLVCRTSFLGYHHFVCPTCIKSIKVPHSYKSRSCPSCGKKAVIFIAMTSSLSPGEIRLLETKNAGDPVCHVKEECDMCHIGFATPVNYTDNQENTYLFHETKPNIKNLGPDTVMERIFGYHLL